MRRHQCYNEECECPDCRSCSCPYCEFEREFEDKLDGISVRMQQMNKSLEALKEDKRDYQGLNFQITSSLSFVEDMMNKFGELSKEVKAIKGASLSAFQLVEERLKKLEEK